MNFYEMLSKKYNEIFPVSDLALSMMQEITPAGGHILDIGSATGQYVEKLRCLGFNAFGLEYSADIIRSVYTAQGDMTFPPFKQCFDTVMCAGNTLAHASHHPHAMMVMRNLASVIKDKGKALIQILNYEKILNGRPTSLPPIKTSSCLFERYYSYQGDMVTFTGRLTSGQNTAESSVELYPITPKELLEIGFKSGFRTIEFFENYDRTGFDIDNSFMLIALMSK